MSETKNAMIYAIEDGKKYTSNSNRKKRQVYKVLLSDVLDENGNCFISELYEKDGSGWNEIENGGCILSDNAGDVFKFFNKHGIGLDGKVGDWDDILDKEILFLL